MGLGNKSGEPDELSFTSLPIYPELPEIEGIVVCPWGWGTMGYHGPGAQDVMDVLEQVMNEYPVDQGQGISDKALQMVFEPFFTTKSNAVTGDMGLGLSISKSIVEAMGGTIDFECEEGKGTVFRISVPLTQD